MHRHHCKRCVGSLILPCLLLTDCCVKLTASPTTSFVRSLVDALEIPIEHEPIIFHSVKKLYMSVLGVANVLS